MLLASFEEVLVAILMCGYVLGPPRQRGVRVHLPAVASLSAVVILVGLEALRSGSSIAAVLALREHCRYLILALLVGHAVAQRRVRSRDVLWWIAVAGVGVCVFQLIYSFTDWQPFLSYFGREAKETEEIRTIAGFALHRRAQVTFGGPSALCDVVCPSAVVWFVLAFERGPGRVLKIATALALLATAALTISYSLVIALFCAAVCVVCAVVLRNIRTMAKSARWTLAIVFATVVVALSNVRIGGDQAGLGLSVRERMGAESSVYTKHLHFPSVGTALVGQGLEIVGGGGLRPDNCDHYGDDLVDSGWAGLLPQLGIPVSLWILFTIGLIVWMAVKAAAASPLGAAQGSRRELTGLAACGALGACLGSVHVLPWQNFAGLDVIFVTLIGVVIGLSARFAATPVPLGTVTVKSAHGKTPLTPAIP
jgi:hypothetical protein